MTSDLELSATEISFFRDAGYLRLPWSIDDSLRRRLLEKVSALYRSGQFSASEKMYGFYQKAPDLAWSLFSEPALKHPLKSLLGPNVVMVLNRHNTAALNPPGPHGQLHRDVLHWSRPLVTAIVYLEQSTLESGCTYVVPTSHNLPFVGVTQPDGGGTWMDGHAAYARMEEQQVPLPMRRGGILLFDALTFHAVGANTSDATRASLTFGFRAADELDSQPDLSRQILISGEFSYRGNDLTP